jgi:NRPS condensation-like uncharacterized protein
MNSHPAPAFDLFNVFFQRIYEPSIHIVLSFDGRLDETKMKTATERLIGANPYLGSRFRVVDGVPAWEEVPDDRREAAFSFSEEDRDPEIPPPPLDVYKAPQVRVGLFREEAGDTLVITIHHGFCDVSGLFSLTRDLFSTYRGIFNDPGYRPPSTGAYDRGTNRILSRYSEEERTRARDGTAPFIDRWRFPVERTGRGRPRISSVTLAPDRLRAISSFAKEHGATVNDALIGAYFLAFLRVRDDPADRDAPRGILTSADMRRSLPDPDACPPMNLSIAFELTLSVPEGTGLAEIIGDIAAETTLCKAGAFDAGCILFYEDLHARGVAAVDAFFDEMADSYMSSGLKSPVFSNLGIIDEDDFLPVPGPDGAALGLRDARIVPCVCWPCGFLTVASTFRGRLTLATAYEEGPYSAATVERFLGSMDESLP